MCVRYFIMYKAQTRKKNTKEVIINQIATRMVKIREDIDWDSLRAGSQTNVRASKDSRENEPACPPAAPIAGKPARFRGYPCSRAQHFFSTFALRADAHLESLRYFVSLLAG